MTAPPFRCLWHWKRCAAPPSLTRWKTCCARNIGQPWDRCAATISSRASAPRSSTRTAIRNGRPRRWRPSPRRRRGLLRAGRPRTGVPETNYETILVDRDERVGTITLNRPKALNALNSQVMHEVTTAAAEFDNDPGSAPSSSPATRRRSRRVPTSRRCRSCPSATCSARTSSPRGEAGRGAHAADRRGGGLRARRRLRAGDDVRPADRRRHRQVRPARDQARRAAGQVVYNG